MAKRRVRLDRQCDITLGWRHRRGGAAAGFGRAGSRGASPLGWRDYWGGMTACGVTTGVRYRRDGGTPVRRDR
ncbi:hypothetical protein GCM10010411_80880 [Actinomadura fulvescens]|uniref:Uncharacterized protein n=1 Tax=Actinomadura fulvescens TaxID=46160 RepID=A0ABN3QN79_9ACTN